jgi:V/A-type H+-transporting ATPase subunit C
MKSKASRYDYGFACGRISVLTTRLIDRTRFQRMVDAADANEAFRILAETEYGPALAEVKGPAEYETVLARELDRVYSLLAELAPDPFLMRMFGYRFDAHNIKVLLKAQALGQDHSHLLVHRGTIPPEELTESIASDSDAPAPFTSAVTAARQTFGESGDPQVIDTVIDGALYGLLAKEARRRKYEIVRNYMEISIDLTNIRTFLRVRRLDKGEDFLRQVLLTGGTLAPDRFLKLAGAPLDQVDDDLGRTPYWKIVSEGIRLLRDNAPLAGLEKLADDYATDAIKQARYVPLGPEPLFAYILAKENEIRNLRIIFAGKVNGVRAEVIRERLRDVNV